MRDTPESKKDWETFVNLILPLIVDIKANSKPGDSGERECPKCQKRLWWDRAPSNGHLHMGCETALCVQVME